MARGVLFSWVLAAAFIGFVQCSDAGEPTGSAGAPATAGNTSAGSAGALGEAGSAGSAGSPSDPVDQRFERAFVKKAESRPDGKLMALLERPRSMREEWHPERELHWLAADGSRLNSFRAGEASELVDFTLHPSGEVTALLAADSGYTLVRFDRDASTLATAHLEDPAIDSDEPPRRPSEPGGPIEENTHDAGRVAAFGEDVIVATRTARHSVVAYRFASLTPDAKPIWRALVVPPLNIAPVGLTGGTYDTFGQIAGQYGVQLAVGGDGVSYVGVRYPIVSPGLLPRVHERVFGERLVGDPDACDAYVTRLDPDGARLGTTVVGTDEPDELYGLRAVGGAAYAVGRVEHWNDSGTGFDAFVARVDGQSGALELRELDVEASDIAFDAVPLAFDEWLVIGASGYSQNPRGASVSEASRAFALRSRANGESARIELPREARHEEARTLAIHGERWLVGGMLDGPGTHSADADASALRAAGFLVEIRDR